MDYVQMTAHCGLDCFNCGVYLARDNEQLRAGIAQRLNIPVEQVVCDGCRNENGTIGLLGMTEPCNVYKCISKKGFQFCYEFEDFPCDHLHPYADLASRRLHNTKVFNLCLIKRMGLESWARNKAQNVRDKYFKEKLRL